MPLDRRSFMARLGMGLAASAAQPIFGAVKPVFGRGKKAVETLNTARNLIFVHLSGAPSHVDTFDLKLGSYTPDFIGSQDFGAGWIWPVGTLPLLAERRNKFSIIRSITGAEVVHNRARYHLFTAHRELPATRAKVPHVGSVLAHMLSEDQVGSKPLPPFVYIGFDPAGNGILPASSRGVQLSEDGELPYLNHPYENSGRRMALLDQLWEVYAGNSIKRAEHLDHQYQAKLIMDDPELDQIFRVRNLANTSIIDDFLFKTNMAVDVLAADKGTRSFYLAMGGWDHHQGIYSRGEFRVMSRAFDIGFSNLLDRLSNTPGQAPGKTLYDETLVVAMGEFGRTVGQPNGSGGRDHWAFVVPAVIAGGGSIPGRIIGSSDDLGGFIRDRGWSLGREMTINDVVATIYSAMGIDYTQDFGFPGARSVPIINPETFGPAHHIREAFV